MIDRTAGHIRGVRSLVILKHKLQVMEFEYGAFYRVYPHPAVALVIASCQRTTNIIDHVLSILDDESYDTRI